MAGFSELIPAYAFTDAAGEQVGVRAFFEDPDGVEDLPVKGDPFPVSAQFVDRGCVVQSVGEKHYEEQSSLFVYMVNYSTRTQTLPSDEGGGQSPDTEFDALQRTYSASGQMIMLGGTPNFSAGLGRLPSNKVFAKFQPTMSVTIQKNFEDQIKMRDQVRDAIGKLNDAPFEGAPIDFQLFNGFRANRFKNRDGDLEYAAFLTFEWIGHGWNQEWSPDAQGFRDLDVEKYEKSDFSGNGLFKDG